MNGVKRSGVRFSIIIWNCHICQITSSLTIKKTKGPNIINFTIFRLWERIGERKRVQRILKIMLFKLQFMIEKYWSEVLTPFLRFLTSQSCVIRSQGRKIVKFMKFGTLISLNCERMWYLTDVPASHYDRKTDARPFDTIHDILRCLCLIQSLLKGRNAPIWRIGNRRVKFILRIWFFCVLHQEHNRAEIKLIVAWSPYKKIITET